MSAGNSGQSFHSYEADIPVICPISPVSAYNRTVRIGCQSGYFMD